MWMTLISSAIPLLKKYWELILIIFLVIAFGIYIARLKGNVRRAESTVTELRETIEVLEISNQTLVKNLAFFEGRIRILNAYSNSLRNLQSMSNYQLPADQKSVLDEIKDEYQFLFPSLRLSNSVDFDKEWESMLSNESLLGGGHETN